MSIINTIAGGANAALDAVGKFKAQQAAAQTSGGPTTAQGASGAADRDTFLKLLVEQLKHQDPLAPQDGAQFVAQLAQFNSLDQLITINQRLEQLLNK